MAFSEVPEFNTIILCSEENTSIPDIGVDMLLKDGKLDNLKNGPLYWVDTSDSQPCLGTASAAMWTLKCRGRLAHSGLPQQVHLYEYNYVCIRICTCVCLCVCVLVTYACICMSAKV